jgi:hypothetical protein
MKDFKKDYQDTSIKINDLMKKYGFKSTGSFYNFLRQNGFEKVRKAGRPRKTLSDFKK